MEQKSVMKACPRHHIAIGYTGEDTISEYTTIVEHQPIVMLEDFILGKPS